MRAILIAGALGLVAATAGAAETRCGWIENPTTHVWSLIDSKTDWKIMSSLDDDGPPGMDLIPDLTERDWQATGPAHGYACGCMQVDTDPAAERITRIYKVTQKPLKVCKADKTLLAP